MYVRQALTDGATLPAMFYFNRIKHTGCHDIQYTEKETGFVISGP